MERKSYLYQHYTWPELGDVTKKQPVVVLPIGSVEDHGRHLPLDTDNFIIWSICESAAQKAGGDILLCLRSPTALRLTIWIFPGLSILGWNICWLRRDVLFSKR